MPSVRANGITIEYERDGQGEPILLIMGLAAQLTAWPPAMVERLVEHGFDVIRHDNRDIGLSSEIDADPPSPVSTFLRRLFRRPPSVPYLVADMADDAAALLDALDIDSAHVVGASMGGMIAQELAIRHPERVRSLTSIMSHPGDGSGSPRARVALRLARRGRPSRDEAVESTVGTFRMIAGPHFDELEMHQQAEAAVARSYRPEGVLRQTAAVLASRDRVPLLRQVRVPTLVVHGLVDPLVRYSGGIATALAVPGARLLMFNDMGHDLPASRVDELAQAIATNAGRSRPGGGELTRQPPAMPA